MNIALLGYGKMGKAIEKVAVERGHTIGLKVGSANAGASTAQCEVAIEFSRPENALGNIRACLREGTPVVVGTTGWYDHFGEVRELVREHNGTLLWASNFSIGVNLFFRVNRMLAALMDHQKNYAVHIDEVHHVHKLDAPSGTAITLASDIDLKCARYSGWDLLDPTAHPPAESAIAVPINSERVGEVPGKHSVTWKSAQDRIVITHEAFGREGFALGAVVAAEWLRGRKGLFSMDEVLSI